MPIETWATVRVEDTGDGLIIHPDDAREWRLRDDHQYSGYFLPDGRYRIALTPANPAMPIEELIWQCKDYADGWISFPSEREAATYQAATGCAVRTVPRSTPTAADTTEQLALYRDIFAEITAKATALEFDPDDPERITAYRIPCGPLHRAAGKLGFQMFDGERYLTMSQEENAALKTALAEYTKNMEETVIPQIEADIREREINAAQLRYQPIAIAAAADTQKPVEKDDGKEDYVILYKDSKPVAADTPDIENEFFYDPRTGRVAGEAELGVPAMPREQAAAYVVYIETALASAREQIAELTDRVDELEQDANCVSTEFEKECWVAMRRLLTHFHYDFSDTDTDGIQADDAEQFIREQIAAVERENSRLLNVIAGKPGGDAFLDALSSAQETISRLTEALAQVKTVCADNAPATCRHDLALKFIEQVADAAYRGEQA